MLLCPAMDVESGLVLVDFSCVNSALALERPDYWEEILICGHIRFLPDFPMFIGSVCALAS
jgi:hypothetical protein